MSEIKFTTNGMFILDDIHTLEGEIHKDIIGGAGTFAIIGSLMVCPGKSKWILDSGTDFPKELEGLINSWDKDCTQWRHLKRLTTRGINYYKGNNGLRLFEYLTPKKQIFVKDWFNEFGPVTVAGIECVHVVSSTDRLRDIVEGMLKVRNTISRKPKDKKLAILWEPLPDVCHHDNLPEMIELFKEFSSRINFIFSPNSEEASRLLGNNHKDPSSLEECKEISTQLINDYVHSLAICVIRCGKFGSLTYHYDSNNKLKMMYMPAYHCLTPEEVVDPTGGGNSFLGGFAMGYIESKGNLEYASCCGNVVSGCIIEQTGIPDWNPQEKTWNGTSFKDRLNYYYKEVYH